MSELLIALAKAQAEMRPAKFDKVNPHFKSKYASLASVIDAVQGPLTKYGISYAQQMVRDEHGHGIETVLRGHGQELYTGVVPVIADKNNAQGFGSGMSYARRYSLSMACCIASDDDDDGNAAPASAPKKDGRVVTAALEGETWDAQKCQDYVHAITVALAKKDHVGLAQLSDEIKTDMVMQLAVSQAMDSTSRRQLKEFNDARRAEKAA